MDQEEINRVTMIHATQKEWTHEEREAWPEWLREMRSVLVENPAYVYARVTANGSVTGGTSPTQRSFSGRDMMTRGFVLYREMLRDTLPVLGTGSATIRVTGTEQELQQLIDQFNEYGPVMEAKPLPPAKPVVSEEWTDEHTEQLREANERMKLDDLKTWVTRPRVTPRDARRWDRDMYGVPSAADHLDARIAVARTEFDRPVSAPRFPHEGRSERALPRSNARR